MAQRSEATRRQSLRHRDLGADPRAGPGFSLRRGPMGLVDYCRTSEGYRVSCHRSLARGDWSQTPSRWRANLRLAHRRQIVATAFRTSSTAPRIKAITTTTTAAMHTARMSFSIAVRSELFARSPDQVQVLRNAGGPRSQTVYDARLCGVLHSRNLSNRVGTSSFRPSPALAGSSNGNCRTTSKTGVNILRSPPHPGHTALRFVCAVDLISL